MKKLFITTLLLGICVACNVDDVDSDLTPVAITENSADCVADNPPSILGRTYLRSGFEIDTPVDANGDGIYSTDLMEEQLCFDLSLSFGTDLRVSNPTFDAVSLYVDNDGNGNLSQRMNCSHADGLPNRYMQIGDTIKFFISTSEEPQFTGTLSADETTITFEFTNDLLFGFNFLAGGNEILLQDGTVLEYEGGATVTYTLQ
ncbi:hypothetical protein [uncultured Kordia sp.]|uniref:hypothetical protein n=1 Tax=uncultured Kordia sp. TaxID=507699 RepID=UPI00261267F3|nr:hypothetical protein [uncultured Kordia sp.]